MKKQLTALLLFCTVLLTCGCAYAAISSKEPAYNLYYQEADLESAVGRDALRACPVQLEENEASTEELAEALMLKLLSEPEDNTLINPIPMGTLLLSLEIRAGEAVVDLSSTYAMLSGVDLTLADYAITLTLTQLPGVSAVRITVRGRELAYRDKQLFMEDDVLLSPKEDVVGTVDALLYYLNEEGEPEAEQRTLDLYEGDTQAGAVARALEQEPESKNLYPIFPEGFRVKAVWLEDQVCYVNLSSMLMNHLPEDRQEARKVLDALGLSLCSLDSVSEVSFLVDGGFYKMYRGIPMGEPFVKE